MSPFIWEWSICPWSIGFVLSPAGGPGSWAIRDSPTKKANVKAALVRPRVEAREQQKIFILTLSVFDSAINAHSELHGRVPGRNKKEESDSERRCSGSR